MNTRKETKSTVDQIRARFDREVHRFTNLQTGQTATIDAPLAMELITRAAVSATPAIRRCLDIGCGAGNNTLRLLAAYGAPFECDLCDLSGPMLTAASNRVTAAGVGNVRMLQGDFRELELVSESYDVILAAAVLHHLRDDADWERTFRKIHALLRTGGTVWITDLVSHEMEPVDAMMWSRYGRYLEDQGGRSYREEVFSYIEIEDSPRPVTYQLDLLRRVGFRSVDLLHKNSNFAAFGALK